MPSATSRALVAVLTALSALGCTAPLSRPDTRKVEHLWLDREWLVEEGATVETGAARPARPFDQALASWNVRVPPGAGFTVELRVRSAVTGDWSPWLAIGEWGAVDPTRAWRTEFEGGRIDVDWFVGDELFDLASLRFTATSGACTVERWDLCFSRSDEPLGGGPRPAAVSLSVPPRSQRVEDPAIADRICSPTSVAMVLQYEGVDVSTAEVARLVYDERHDLYGNWTKAVQGAFTLGVGGYLKRFGDWSAVAVALERGRPIVASIRTPEGGLTGAPYVSTSGHLLVIRGFDERGDVLVNDPAAPDASSVPRVYSRAELEEAWMGKGGVAYVFSGREFSPNRD